MGSTELNRQELPTILDLIDSLSYPLVAEMQKWEHTHPSWASFFGYTPEGKYYLSKRDDGARLIPSGHRGAYFRGQNHFYEKCKPSLYRITDHSLRVIERIKCYEFINLLFTHPVLNSLIEKERVTIDKMALAQHYGFATNLIDISCDIWSSAFFATTKYNSVDGSYTPVDENYGDGIGVMYVSKRVFYDPRINDLGFNFFPRPYKQMGATYSMGPNEDFNKVDMFKKLFFRHDKQASEWVYEMSYRQKKYFPDDILAEKAAQIQNTHVLSTMAVKALTTESPISFDEIKNICEINNYRLTDSPIVSFEKDYCEAVLKQWEETDLQIYMPLMKV